MYLNAQFPSIKQLEHIVLTEHVLLWALVETIVFVLKIRNLCFPSITDIRYF